MKILLTGFDIFNNESINPSYEVIKDLKIDNVNIDIIKVPVVYDECFDVVLRKIKEFNPDYVISFGLASDRKYITLELLAINYMYAKIADNNGVIKNGEKIIGNQEAIFTSINVNEIIDSLNKDNDVYRLSLSAGAYVCNNLYYHILLNQKQYNYKGLFVHVPSFSSMSLSDMKIYVKKLIEEVINK